MSLPRNRWNRIASAVWVAVAAFVPPLFAAPTPSSAVTTPSSNAPIASTLPNQASNTGSEPTPTPDNDSVANDPNSMPNEAPADQIETSDAVPPSTIDVTTLDARSNAVAGVRIELIRDRQSISEGNESTKWQATTDAQGHARFSQVPSGSDTQYRVVALEGSARYGTRQFTVESRAGTKVIFHVYEVVNDFKQALVAGRGFLFVEPRDEVLMFEYMHQFHNLGQTVLTANDLELRLPKGWKAFSTNPTDSDLAVKKTDQGVALVGSIAPGKHSTMFTFQIPKANRDRIELDVDLWPNTAEAQVATLTRPGLELAVEGFPNTEVTKEPGRPPFLVTRRAFTRDNGPPASLHIEVAGLPVVGPGRWVAAIAGSLLALWALVTALARRDTRRADDSHANARARIVDELATLELAHRQGKLGDATYADTREILLSAFVRVERETVSS